MRKARRWIAAVKKSAMVALCITVGGLLALPLLLSFAFDDPSATWTDVTISLLQLYIVYGFLPWFGIGLAFQLVRRRS